MNLLQLIAQVVAITSREECRIALAGGLAANLYRQEIRATNDVDLLIEAAGHEIKIAAKVLRGLGSGHEIATRASLTRKPGMGEREKWMVVGARKPPEPTVDFILPAMP